MAGPKSHRTPRQPALAVHRRMLAEREMELWPYCEWSHCSRPAMEVLEVCLADSGERLIRPFRCCSFHADALPLPPFTHSAPSEP